jgi:hypothetical protein
VDRFVLSRVLSEPPAIILYDTQLKRVVSVISDYADELLRRLDPKSVLQEVGYLKQFWSYLDATSRRVNEINDHVLEEFRARSLQTTLGSKAHRGSRHAAMKTINLKLVRVYLWLEWLQDTGRAELGLIGLRDCRVRCAPALLAHGWSRRARSATPGRYPLLFRVANGRSKHSIPRTVPSEATLDRLHAHFFEHASTPYLAHRNALIVDFANETGFRRESINSLTIDQFIGSDFKAMPTGTIVLQPASQKFDLGNAFEIDANLHARVAGFIATYREDLVQLKKVGPRIHRGAVFLSDRTGAPLTDRSITTLISNAMRAVGCARGVALHAWRAKFAIDEIEAEYHYRSENGLDTRPSTILEAVSLRMGHRSTESLRPYVSWYFSSKRIAERGASGRGGRGIF